MDRCTLSWRRRFKTRHRLFGTYLPDIPESIPYSGSAKYRRPEKRKYQSRQTEFARRRSGILQQQSFRQKGSSRRYLSQKWEIHSCQYQQRSDCQSTERRLLHQTLDIRRKNTLIINLKTYRIMKSFIGAVIFICVALSANAQLLWKVSGNGLSSPSYIMGTHHLAPLSVKDGITGL